MSLHFSLKWNKVSYDDIEISSNVDGLTLKKKIAEITGVPADRQKVMGKTLFKGLLEDTILLSTLPFKPEASKNCLVMMGTAPEGSASAIEAPKEKIVFVEELGKSANIVNGVVLPSGLENLGNTCYLNSTIQCLKPIPELQAALEYFHPSNAAAHSEALANLSRTTKALGDTLRNLNTISTTGKAVVPMQLVLNVRQAFPRFAEQSSRGGYIQQDSDEFYNVLASALSECLRKESVSLKPWFSSVLSSDEALLEKYNINNSSSASSSSSRNDAILPDNVMDILFGVEMEAVLKCKETDLEPPVVSRDQLKRFQCTINETVNHLDHGIRIGLEGELEKNSEILGRNAKWSESKKITRLPKYLVIQMNRFFWKQTPNSRDHRGVNCKILRPVTFPAVLDVYNYCSTELQSILKVPRDKHSEEMMVRSKKVDDAKKADLSNGNNNSSASATTSEIKNNDQPMDIDKNIKSKNEDMQVDDEDPELKAALAMSMSSEANKKTKRETAGFLLSPNFQGNYELFSVVTHKGRGSNEGHYMSWVKQSNGKWVVFDDDHPAECDLDKVLDLKGGGDYDMAYMLFYRAIDN